MPYYGFNFHWFYTNPPGTAYLDLMIDSKV